MKRRALVRRRVLAFAVVVLAALAGGVYGSNVADAAPGQPAMLPSGSAWWSGSGYFDETQFGDTSTPAPMTLNYVGDPGVVYIYFPADFVITSSACTELVPGPSCTAVVDVDATIDLDVVFAPTYRDLVYYDYVSAAVYTPDGVTYIAGASTNVYATAWGLGQASFGVTDLGDDTRLPSTGTAIAAAGSNDRSLQSIELTDDQTGAFTFDFSEFSPCTAAGPTTLCVFQTAYQYGSTTIPVACVLPDASADVEATATLVLSYEEANGAPADVAVPLSCRGTHVQFATTPSAPLAVTACDDEAVSIDLTLEVAGELPLRSQGLPTLDDAGALDYSLSLPSPQLAFGGGYVYPGDRLQARLQLRDDAPVGAYPVRVTLATINAPTIEFDVVTTVVPGGVTSLVEEIDFGDVEVDQVRAGQIAVKVCVAEGVTIDAIDAPLGFDAGTTSPTVDHQGTATVLVLFHPTEVQAYDGDLTIDTSAGAVVVPLRGEGVGETDDTESQSYYGCNDVGAGGASTLPLIVIGLALTRRRRRAGR